jgi:hypothetical protein
MVNSSTLMATLAPPSPGSTLVGTWPRLPRRNLKRPRGLWKARRRLEPTATVSSSSPAPSSSYQQQTSGRASCSSARGSDTDREEEMMMMTMAMMDESGDDYGNCNDEDEEDEEDDDMSQGSSRSSSSKRQRCDSGSGHILLTERQQLWTSDLDNNNNDHTPASSPLSSSGVVVVLLDEKKKKKVGHDVGVRSSEPPRRPRPRRTRPPMISNMITTSIAENATCSSKGTFEVKDWEELKETLARASELYDRACSPFYRRVVVADRQRSGEDMLGSITLLRAVIHECRRFLCRFPDPTVFFTHWQRDRSSSPRLSPDSDNQSTHR